MQTGPLLLFFSVEFSSSLPVGGSVHNHVTQMLLLLLRLSSPSGVPKVLQSRFSLPLALVCVPCSPAKTTKFKVTLETNQPPLDLRSLFPGQTLAKLPHLLGRVVSRELLPPLTVLL